ncbi:hypothetical protein INS49_004780 [Diaporthe citri]|uniref:uncharacterized protein n=1 Tax=Diaporthe citri TaxID=83186 RepID=UPI001C8055EE|nr:uncharacterized protein INS49_004780 [Diaporthe citri]KAG6354176.1 hypothetical protein INS49_004780 [Diaporthe citri]
MPSVIEDATMKAPLPTVKEPGLNGIFAASEVNGSDRQTSITVENVRPPVEHDHSYWWTRCAPLLATLLDNSGSYTPEQKSKHLRIFRDVVIPTLGPTPERAKVTSMLTIDGSPVEPSWNFQQDSNIVRYSFEPLWDNAGTPENPFPGDLMPTLSPLLRYVSDDADLRWFNQVWDAWNVTGQEAQAAKAKLPPHKSRIPQVFFAFDLKREKCSLKAYVFPILKHLATGLSTKQLVFDQIRSLQPYGDAFAVPAAKLERFMDTYSPGCTAVMIAVDCIDPSKARFKIYCGVNSNSKSVVREMMTLGGAQTDDISLKGVEQALKIWHLLLDERDGLADDQAKAPRDPQHQHTRHLLRL